MLDHFTIFTRCTFSTPCLIRRVLTSLFSLALAGVVLWSKSFTPQVAADLEAPSTSSAGGGVRGSNSNAIDALIRETFVEERTAEGKFEKDAYALRWSFANEFELIFVVSVVDV